MYIQLDIFESIICWFYVCSNQIEQISKERDKAKRDLQRAERSKSLLVDEIDDHNSTMESLNESKIK